METRENIHQKLNNLFFSELANSLSAPLIKKISCINKGDFNNRFDLRVAKDESQLGNWWRHPIYVIAKPSAENVVINITIQPQRWPADGEKYANDHKDSIDKTNQEINDLIKSYSINAPLVKKDIKTEGKFVLSYALSVTIDNANPTDADYSKFINFLSSLCQITVSLSDALPVSDANLIDESIDENAKPYLISFNEGTIEDIDTFIDFLINKIEITADFIKKRIDDKLLGFILFDFDYDNLKQLPDFASIDNSDLRNLLKSNILLDLKKYNISVQDLRPKLVFIFDPKDSELAIWKEEFLDLSSILDLNITIFGDNNEYCDIVYQQYDSGNWEEGIVACDQGYMEDLSLDSYCYNLNPDDFPDKLFFKIETYKNNIRTYSTTESNEIKIAFSSSKTNVDDEKESMNGIQCFDLEKIKIAFEKKDATIDQTLKDIIDKYPYGLECQINSESYEDIFGEIEKSYSILFDGNSLIEEQLKLIKNNSDDDDKKWHDALVFISTELEKTGKGLYSTLSPSGGSDYVFLALNKNKYIIPLVILYHFSDTLNNASGWFEEYIEDYNISYIDFISKYNPDNNNIKSVYSYEEKDGFFGTSFEGNARFINLNEEIFNAALAGMMAAKKFC